MSNFSRLGMGPPGQTLVDWAWDLQDKQAVDWAWDLQRKQAVEKSRLVEEEMLSKQESRRCCYKAAPGKEEQQLLLSKARTRAAGGGEVKSGAGAEVICLIWLKLACLYTQVQALCSTDT